MHSPSRHDLPESTRGPTDQPISGGPGRPQNVKARLGLFPHFSAKTLRKLIFHEFFITLHSKVLGGIDLDEVEKIFCWGGLKLQTQVIERFNELDANKNGKLEQSEVKSDGEGEDYMLSFFLGFIRAIAFW